MMVERVSPTRTITPKTHLRTSSPRIMTIGNKGMTDRLASTGTLIFQNLARSLSLALQPHKHRLRPSSGRARRDGPEAQQTDRITTGER